MPKVHNIDFADVVGITARLPDDKEQRKAALLLDEVLTAVQQNPRMPVDEVKQYVAKLDTLNAAKPSIEALRNALTTPQALQRTCLALSKLWNTQDQSKPQVSVASRPGTVVRHSEQEDEAWRTIMNS